jgi:hypothetical protein
MSILTTLQNIFSKPTPAQQDIAKKPSLASVKPTGNISQRHNNPGNLIFMGQEGATRGELKGYNNGSPLYWAKFDSTDSGMKALRNDILSKVKNNPEWNIKDFVNVYAPASDNNNTAQYVRMIQDISGISPKAKISEFITPFSLNTPEDRLSKIAETIAQIEGFNADREKYVAPTKNLSVSFEPAKTSQASASSILSDKGVNRLPILGDKINNIVRYVTGVDIAKTRQVYKEAKPYGLPDASRLAEARTFSPLVKDVARWTIQAGAGPGTAISELATGIGSGAETFGRTLSPVKALKAFIDEQGRQDITKTEFGQSKIGKSIFGEEPIKSTVTSVAEREQLFRPYVGKSALPLAVGATALEQYFNFEAGGGKNLVNLLVKETDPGVISKLLKKAGVSGELLGKASGDISKINNPEGVRNYLTVLKKQIVNPKLKPLDKSAIVTHNLTESKLNFAIKKGGLANPSMAVADLNKAHVTGYGDITLVAPKDILSEGRTFRSDVYTPRYPSTVQIMKREDKDRLIEYYKKYEPIVGARATNLDLDRVVQSSLDNSSLAMADFFDKNGIKYPIVKEADGTIAEYRTLSKFRDIIQKNKLQAKFDNYIQDILGKFNVEEKIYSHNTYMGRPVYKPNTLENASKIMNSRGVRAGEGFDYGLPSLRAKLVPTISGEKKIKSSLKNYVLPSDEFEKVKDDMWKRYEGVIDKVLEFNPASENSNRFIHNDQVAAGVSEFLVTGERQYLPKGITEDVINDLLKLKKEIIEMPTEYFETKFRKPIGISRFKYAVVPEGTSLETIDNLKNHGISIVKYKKGSEASRLEALRKVGKKEAFGAVAGVEVDDDGKIQFNPLKAGAGVLALGAIRNVKDIPNLQREVEALEEYLADNPLKRLDKYANKREGKLGEGGLGKGRTIWMREGDQIAQEFHSIYPQYPEDANELGEIYEQFAIKRREFKALKAELQLLKSTPEYKIGSKIKEYSEKTIERINKEIQMFNSKTGAIPELPKQEIYKPEEAIFDAGVRNAQRAEEYQQYLKTITAKLDEVAMGRPAKNTGMFQKLKEFLAPAKYMDDKSRKIYSDWTKEILSAKEFANAEIAKYKIPEKEGWEIIKKYQAGENTPYNQAIKDAFDSMFREANKRGLTVNYWQNYLPQVYKESAEEIKAAIVKYMRENNVSDDAIDAYISGNGTLPGDVAARLKINPSFSKERTFPDYETAIKFGLNPKYTNPAQLIAYYRGEMEKTIANKKFMTNLVEAGKVFPTELAPDSFKPLNLPFANEKYSATPEVANALNGIFRKEEDLGFLDKVFSTGAWTNRFVQELRLSAGVPKSSINFFVFGQFLKELSSFNPRAVIPFVRANFNSSTIKYFTEKAPYLKMMAEEGIDVSHRVGSLDKVYKNLVANKKMTELAGESFDKLFNEKTFASFMPQLYVDAFERTYKSALKKGLPEGQAKQLAGDTVKAFYGLSDNLARSKLSQDVLTTMFFAPKFREGIINMLFNTAKSLTTEFRNPAFKLNRRFAAGAVLSYALYNYLNRKLTGNYMWDNEPGKEFELKAPLPNGDAAYVALLPSILSLPRNLGSGFIALGKGDISTAEQKFGSLFSMPVKIVSEVIANKDYFGRQIYKETDEGKTKIGKIAEYVGLQSNHPYMTELYNRVLKPLWDKDFQYKKNPVQSALEALEFPIKFKTKSQIDTQKYFDALAEQVKKRAEARRKVEPVFKQIQELRNQGNELEARRLLEGLSESDYEIYKTLSSSAKRAKTQEAKKIVYPKYIEIQKLLEEGRYQEAKAILNKLSDQEYKAYKLLKDNMD